MSLLHLETEENPRNDYEKPDWISLCLAHFHSPGSRRRFLERVICLSLSQAGVTLSRKWLLDMFTLDTIWQWYMVLTQRTGLIWNKPCFSVKFATHKPNSFPKYAYNWFFFFFQQNIVEIYAQNKYMYKAWTVWVRSVQMYHHSAALWYWILNTEHLIICVI